MIRARYNSIAEFLAAAFDITKAHLDNVRRANGYEVQAHGRQWFGPFKGDYKAAKEALQGWPEGTAKLASLAESLEVPPPMSTVRRIRRADQGDDLDIQDVYAGRLDTAWRVAKRDHRATRSREVWLGHFMTINATTSGDVIYWRGAAILALADILTTAGYSVGIVTYNGSRGTYTNGESSRCEVVVKDPLAPLDINALAGAIVNPGFFRIAGFHWFWAQAQKANSSLGHAEDYPLEGVIQGTQAVRDQASARAYIQKVIKELNGGDNAQAA